MSYAGPANQKNQLRPARARLARMASLADDRNVAFIAGIVLGAAVGAGVTLLLAPRSGRSTRRRIAHSGHQITQRGRDAWHDLADELMAARRRRQNDRAAAKSHRPAGQAAAERKSFSRRAASSL